MAGDTSNLPSGKLQTSQPEFKDSQPRIPWRSVKRPRAWCRGILIAKTWEHRHSEGSHSLSKCTACSEHVASAVDWTSPVLVALRLWLGENKKSVYSWNAGPRS